LKFSHLNLKICKNNIIVYNNFIILLTDRIGICSMMNYCRIFVVVPIAGADLTCGQKNFPYSRHRQWNIPVEINFV
jgi:hypothetical protein